MKKNTKYKLVNWVDGMSVSKEHQIQTENYFMATLCESLASRLSYYNYGLLPTEDTKKSSSEFQIIEQITNRIEIRLQRCHAITLGGYRINYQPENGKAMSCEVPTKIDKNKNSSENSWDIILSINPFKRIAVGEPDPDENPPRHPDVEPGYSLSAMPSGQINPNQLGMYHLLIGRIHNQGKLLQVDKTYIPPCTSMSAHSDLLEYYEKFSIYMNRIELAARNIIAKVQNQQKTSSIAVNVNAICQDIMRYISTIYFMYRNVGKTMEPVLIVNYFSTLAHCCLSAFCFLNKQEKEELLKYFYDWNDVTPGAFEELLADTSAIIYNHNDIRSSMISVDKFLNIFSNLWTNLSVLEYIGQSKENIVVTVKSSQQDVEPSTWSVID